MFKHLLEHSPQPLVKLFLSFKQQTRRCYTQVELPPYGTQLPLLLF